MNTKILEYIIAIAQEHSISRASERFYLTQPVLSRHLKKIEDELGTPLFVRQKDGMALTEAGRIYINCAQNILHLESELESDLRAMLDDEKSTLRVYVDNPYITQLSEQLLPAFHEKYPDVQIRFICGSAAEVQATLSTGVSGIGLLMAPGRRVSGLEYVALHSDELVVAAPEGGQNTDILFMQPAGTGLRGLEDRWLAQAGAAFHTVLEVQTLRAGLEGALSGQGCACVTRSAAERAGLSPRGDIPPQLLQSCAVYPKNMVFPPSTRARLQAILRVAEEWADDRLPRV